MCLIILSYFNTFLTWQKHSVTYIFQYAVRIVNSSFLSYIYKTPCIEKYLFCVRYSTWNAEHVQKPYFFLKASILQSIWFLSTIFKVSHIPRTPFLRCLSYLGSKLQKVPCRFTYTKKNIFISYSFYSHVLYDYLLKDVWKYKRSTVIKELLRIFVVGFVTIEKHR